MALSLVVSGILVVAVIGGFALTRWIDFVTMRDQHHLMLRGKNELLKYMRVCISNSVGILLAISMLVIGWSTHYPY